MLFRSNKELAASKIINYTLLGRRRITWKLGISYDASAGEVKAACQEALDKTPGILEDPAPSICLTDFGGSAVEYTVFCWAVTADYWTVRCELGERLKEAAEARGVEISYNHMNVHIQDMPKIDN